MDGGVRGPAALLWRHRRLLWWLFAMNLALAWLGSLPVRATLGPLLDHSLESAKLVAGFDVGTLIMLLERPEVQLRPLAAGALGAAVLSLLGALFFDGGLLREYLEDRKLSGEDFFAGCGVFFWRMLRLGLLALVPFAGLMALGSACSDFVGRKFHDAPDGRPEFYVNVASHLLLVLAALLVRLWFDLAQARTVRDDERRMLLEVLRSFPLAFRSRLYGQYAGIALAAAASCGLGVWLWLNLPHRAMAASFALLELVTLAQIAARLWMKAASARWVALQVPLQAARPEESGWQPSPEHTESAPPASQLAPPRSRAPRPDLLDQPGCSHPHLRP